MSKVYTLQTPKQIAKRVVGKMFGGKGSGNFDHSGLKGVWGGSGGGKGSKGSLTAQQAVKKGMSAEGYVASKQKLYHGTKEDFDTFDMERSGEIQPSDWGQGAYFTDNPEHAKSFAKVAGGDAVLERYAPDVKFADGDKLLKDSDFMLALDDEMGFTSPAEYLAEKGFGGIKFKNPQGFTEYVVFDPKQIKTKSQLISEYEAAKGVK